MEEKETKLCSDCKKTKEAIRFYSDKSREDGLSELCIKCTVELEDKEYITAKELMGEESVEDKGLTKDVLKKSLKSNRHGTSFAARQPDKKCKSIPPVTNSLAKRYKFYKNCFYEMYKNLTALDLSESTIKYLFGTSRLVYDTYARDEEGVRKYQEAMAELEQKMTRLMLVQAAGYDYSEETIISKRNGRQWKMAERKVHRKFQPGNSQLLIFFMTNKFPEKWKVSKELILGKKETYDKLPGQRDREKITTLAGEILEADTVEFEAEHTVQG